MRTPRWWPLGLAGCAGAVVASRTGPVGLAVVADAALVVVAAVNARLLGTVAVAVGLTANAAVIVADGGMPVAVPAAVAVGEVNPGLLRGTDLGPLHHLERRGDALTALDDRIAVTPLGAVVSPGDLVLWAGVAGAAAAWARPRRRAHLGAAQVDQATLGDHAGLGGDRAVQRVEHGPGHGLLEPAAAGEAAAHHAQVGVAEQGDDPAAELIRQEVHRARFEWHRQAEFPQPSHHRSGHAEAVAGRGVDDDAAGAEGEVHLDAPAAGGGGHPEQLHAGT
ncbi:MAG TPA: DUF5317 family protein [Acidimicrobiales bacterium]|nr:DUF5317 family protein [Acidimicrobiales bacterium]